MKKHIKILSLAVLIFGTMLIGGCNTTTNNENWPYQGTPTVGTNQVPIPKW